MKGNSLALTILRTVIESFGILAVYITLFSYLQNKFNYESLSVIENTGIYLIYPVLLAAAIGKIIITHRGEKRSYSRELLKKSKIGYEVGSFWNVVNRYHKKDELAIIVGVNNRFKLNRDYLHNRSLVYDYVKQFDESTVEQIESDIHSALERKIIDYEPDGSPIFEYGSIYVIPKHNGVKYETALFAMCEPSSPDFPQRFASDRKGLVESFEKMFEQMPAIFTESTLIVPLIGTSSSGSPLSHEEVAKYLISAFADYSRIKHGRLAKNFIISIYNKDIEHEFINLEEIKRHIDRECDSKEFSYSKIKFQMLG